MDLVQPTDEHLTTIMNWFNDEFEIKEWAGPNFPYPSDYETFKKNLNLESLPSFVLLDNDNQCVAFGQCYERTGRCHLGRISVCPTKRGTGIAAVLIKKLIAKGQALFNVQEASLFVLMHNLSAIRAYEKEGFGFAAYPGTIPYDNCLYMTLS